MKQINWQEEVFALISDYFRAHGISYKPGRTIVRDITAYLNLLSKKIKGTPRKVYKSDCFLKRNFTEAEAKALASIETKITNGEDITGHLSRKVLNPKYNDLLFNDWRIHHLHVSDTKAIPSELFFDRSDKLLFVAFSKNHAFFIDVREHSENVVFATKEFLGIMLDNWPPIMKGYVLEHYDPVLFQDFSDEEIDVLRKKGYSFSAVKVRDTVLRNPGIGRTTTGTNLHVAKVANEIYRFVHESTEEYNNNILEIKDKLSELSKSNLESIEVVIIREEIWPFFRLQEKRTGYFIDKKYPETPQQ